jgi:hypothetical protein
MGIRVSQASQNRLKRTGSDCPVQANQGISKQTTLPTAAIICTSNVQFTTTTKKRRNSKTQENVLHKKGAGRQQQKSRACTVFDKTLDLAEKPQKHLF